MKKWVMVKSLGLCCARRSPRSRLCGGCSRPATPASKTELEIRFAHLAAFPASGTKHYQNHHNHHIHRHLGNLGLGTGQREKRAFRPFHQVSGVHVASTASGPLPGPLPLPSRRCTIWLTSRRPPKRAETANASRFILPFLIGRRQAEMARYCRKNEKPLGKRARGSLAVLGRGVAEAPRRR